MQLRIIFLSGLFFFLSSHGAAGQCAVTVSSFPYNESFESGQGGWEPGGIGSDWAWGAPSKSNISTAGTGFKCWMTGGLAGNSYNSGQKSWLRSPCFDLSAIPNPLLRFKIFWDTERGYDGLGFQYSVNHGNTWHNLGTADASANCLNINWFNEDNIVSMGIPGWSGNMQPTSGSCIGGFGSWGWLVAQHDLSSLSGETAVMFRFVFGAGTTCNDYNGIAIDDISILQASTGLANFIYACSGNKTVAFLDSSSVCSTSYSWNFGDPASGAANTSTAKDPVHVFSAAGTYTITQTVSFSNGPASVKTKTISVLDADISTTPVNCFGENNGSATVHVSGGAGTYDYSWNTSPVQNTPSISNLEPGLYIVKVSGTDACMVTDSVLITEPQPLKLNIQNQPEKCGNNNGSLTAGVSGGTAPYTYNWTGGQTTPVATNLQAGNYALEVTDARGCIIDTSGLVVVNEINPVKARLGNDTTICPGETLVLSPGAFASYRWQDNSTAPDFNVKETGTYSVTVEDADGCTSSDSVYVEVNCVDIFFPTAFTPNNDGLNDKFGPGGRLELVRNYSLKIFSRLGDIVYESSDPYKQWDGSIKSTPHGGGAYVWVARYQVNGRKRSQHGTLVLLK